MTTSQNGYSAPIDPVRYELPGGAVSLRSGPTGKLLQWVGLQFNQLVEPLIWPGCWGYNYREIRGATELSNHSSGTALDLNAPKHPLGTDPTTNFSRDQIATIRAIVARTEGCVRWGGDYVGRKDPMHFEINDSEARCAAVHAKLTAQTDWIDMATKDELQAAIHDGTLSAHEAFFWHAYTDPATGKPGRSSVNDWQQQTGSLLGIQGQNDTIIKQNDRIIAQNDELIAALKALKA